MEQRIDGLDELGQRPVRSRPVRRPVDGRVRAPTEIPYDYVALFDLTGRAGNRVERVISISVEGAFVATAIGYGFIPAPPPPEAPPINLFTTALAGAAPDPLLALLDLFDNPSGLVRTLLARWCGIDFLYSIIDSATGRELQNQPLHNIAGLGEPFGGRPFRPMPKPMLFLPRSTIRVVVEEVSEGALYGYVDPQSQQQVTSRLYLALHGYKILGPVR